MSSKTILFLAIAFLGGWLAACPPAPEPIDYHQQVTEIADDAWQYQLDLSPYLQLKHGVLVTKLPDITPEQVAKDVAFARSLVARIDAMPKDAVSHEDALTLDIIRWVAQATIDSEPFYWLTFPVTPYIGGFNLTFYQRVFETHLFDAPDEHAANYLGLLAEYADHLDQLLAHVEGQVERDIRISKQALPGVVGMFRAFRQRAREIFTVAPERLEGFEPGDHDQFVQTVVEAIAARIEPGFDRLVSYLESQDYQDDAPEGVGMSQYPGGEEYYRYLVRIGTTMDVTAEQMHALGQEKVAELMAEMAAIRKEIGFEGSQEEFHQMLRTDKRFLAATPEEVGERLMSYIRRIEPRVSEAFARTPEAPYGVRRLDPEAEAGMTFGYYQEPTPDEPTGLYRFNGSKLEDRSLIWAGPLIFHELVPGHHFHLALQRENESLPMYRRELLAAGAFNEGWASYSALVAKEMGLLDDPYDRYGWALFDMFMSVRLVVDTGMNALGWSRQEARDFMRDHAFQSDTEIATETLRYSTDMPGQALGYKAGTEKFLELRERAREFAGERFDIRDFHEAVLGSGAMPLSILEDHIEWYFTQPQN